MMRNELLIYRMIECKHKQISTSTQQNATENQICYLLQELVSEFASLTSDTELDLFRSKVTTTILDSGIDLFDYHSYMDPLCQRQDTICFWFQFVTVDIMAYLGLYIAIRYHNWHLRNRSIKLLAAVF